MDGVLNSLSPMLHLTRITNAVAAVGNVWFIILWSRASPVEVGAPRIIREGGLPGLLAAGALVAIGMFAFAMALNDTLDLRRDRALHPDRPLPSGRLSMESAVGVIAITLIAATLGSVAFGQQAVLMCLLTASAILFYDAAIKYIPSFGLVALGLIYAAHMLIPNVRLVFVWPVWVAMSHALLVGAMTHRLAGRRPALTPPILILAGAGWVFWSGVLLWVGVRRAGGLWPDGVSLRGAAIAGVLAILFLIVARQKARSTRSRRRAAEKIQRYGSLWLVLYATGWMLGEGYVRETFILAMLACVGFLGMTTLREVYSLLEHPVGFRR